MGKIHLHARGWCVHCPLSIVHCPLSIAPRARRRRCAGCGGAGCGAAILQGRKEEKGRGTPTPWPRSLRPPYALMIIIPLYPCVLGRVSFGKIAPLYNILYSPVYRLRGAAWGSSRGRNGENMLPQSLGGNQNKKQKIKNNRFWVLTTRPICGVIEPSKAKKPKGRKGERNENERMARCRRRRRDRLAADRRAADS